MTEEIKAAGGAVFGVTSEPQTLAGEAEHAWALEFPIVGDPHHEIRHALRERDWLNVYHNEDYGHLREREWADHPNGYLQPAVFAISKSRQILYRWRCVPKYSNMSGAGARPEARYTLERIKAQKEVQTEAPKETQREPQTETELRVDAPLDRDPVMGADELNWFQFLLILTAHGWFIRPRAFPLLRDGDKDQVTPAMARRRVYWFVGAWFLALLMLPLTWVGIAFIAWLLILTPGLVEIHRQFQNEPEPY